MTIIDEIVGALADEKGKVNMIAPIYAIIAILPMWALLNIDVPL